MHSCFSFLPQAESNSSSSINLLSMLPCRLHWPHIEDLSEAGILVLLLVFVIVGRRIRLLDRGGKLLGLRGLKVVLASLIGGLHWSGPLDLGGGGRDGPARAGISTGLSTSKIRNLLQTGHAVFDGADGAA